MRNSTKCGKCGEIVPPFAMGEIKFQPAFCAKCSGEAVAEEEARLRYEKTQELFDYSGLPDAARQWANSEDVLKAGSPGAAKAIRWPFGPTGLYLYGPAGHGKTVAAWHLAVKNIQAGRWVKFLSVPNLLAELGRNFNTEAHRLATRSMEQARVYHVTILDDLGAEQPNERNREAILGLIDHRVNNERPTIITSNLPPSRMFDALGDAHGRIVDRIVGSSYVIRVEGTAFRRKAALDRRKEATDGK